MTGQSKTTYIAVGVAVLGICCGFFPNAFETRAACIAALSIWAIAVVVRGVQRGRRMSERAMSPSTFLEAFPEAHDEEQRERVLLERRTLAAALMLPTTALRPNDTLRELIALDVGLWDDDSVMQNLHEHATDWCETTEHNVDATVLQIIGVGLRVPRVTSSGNEANSGA